MSQALYRRYRPQTFEDVVGQHHITDTLRNALRQERIGHAYLFTGPRGTGKTSTARILAKAVNCQAQEVDDRPDNTCPICQAINEGRLLDLIEIDAASNTSVDDVRELRDRVAFSPSEADYKVYVIDEVHMLSTSAFNALLKTLEEPPPHVIFILATTEPHKIPATVLSRCQRFDFHRISTREIAEHLAALAEKEDVKITPEALGIIVRSATGSMRDAISLLDQIIVYGHVEVDAELVRDVLGMVSGAAVSDLTAALAKGEAADVLAKLHELINQGVELSQLVSQLIDHLRILLLLNVGRDASLVDLPDSLLTEMQAQASEFQPTQLLHAIRVLNEAGLAMKTPFAGYLPVELALLDAIHLGEVPASTPESATAARPTVSPQPRPQPQPQRPPSAPSAPPSSSQRQAVRQGAGAGLDTQWKQIIGAMRRKSPRIQAMLRSGTLLGIEGDQVIISFVHEFHREQVQGAIDQLIEVVSTVLGRPLGVKLVGPDYVPVLDAQPKGDSEPEAPASEASQPPIEEDPVVQTAISEFGAKISRVEPSDS